MPNVRQSLETKYFYQMGFAAMFAVGPACHNYYAKRPLHTGIHRHILWGIFGLIVGHYANQHLENRYVERDAVIKHYVELHPEDFVKERRKFKEIFDEWYPIR